KVINKIITDEAIGDMGKVKLPEDIDEKIASKLNESIYDSDKLLQYDNTYQIYPSNISTKMNRGLNIIIINGWLRVIGKKSDERFDNILLLDLLDIPELKPKKTNSAKIENIYNYLTL
ncbi:MAG: hypothetical protein L6266_03560, partial [Nanoarchaeota archaeon]|nr:hypothetical protein [Nanoarchaeota archaeon]